MIFAGLLSFFLAGCLVLAQDGSQNPYADQNREQFTQENLATQQNDQRRDRNNTDRLTDLDQEAVEEPISNKPALECPDPSSTLDPKYSMKLSKSTAQSSTYANDTNKFGPHLAIDRKAHTFAHTAGYGVDPNPWWRIDLQEPHIINGFSILTRQHSHHWRLHDFEVRVGDVDPASSPKEITENPLCYFHENYGIGNSTLFSRSCSEPLAGRYLSVQIKKLCNGCPEPKYNLLILAEVYIYGCKL